jgi:hypothetical protein
MHRVPDWYLAKGKADSRQIILHIYLYPENNTSTFLLLHSNDIADYDVVKELQDTGVPCSYIGQSSATIKIYNENKRFYTEEFKRYIARGVKVEIETGYYSSNDVATRILFQTRMFTGWIDSFDFDEYGEFVTINAYDSLHYLRNQPSPKFRASADKALPLCDLITYYLELCGLEEVSTVEGAETIWHMGYQVDSNITASTRPLLKASGTIGDVLTNIAQAGICAIYCDAFDVLQVQLVPRTRHLVYTFDDLTQVFSSASSTLGYEDYTHVNVNAYDTCTNEDYTLKRTEQVYYESEMFCIAGSNEYNNLSMDDSVFPTVICIMSDEYMAMPNNTAAELAVNGKGPKVGANEMPMLGAYIYVSGYDYSMDKIDIKLWAAKGMIVDFSVYAYNEGRTVGTVAESVDSEYSPSFFLMKKILEVDCPLISDKAYAQQCANTYAKLIEQGANKIDSSVRGEPALELLDLVAILNPRAAHDSEQVLVTRFHYTYDGSLKCDIEAISYSSVLLLTYAFLGPGFYIPYDPGAIYITAYCDPVDAGLVDGAGAYAYGDVTRISVAAATGWEIDHWEDTDGVQYSSGGTLVEPVEGPKTYIAVMKATNTFCRFTVDVPVDNLAVTVPVMSLTPVNIGTIDWGDGTVETYDPQVEYDHIYPIPGTAEITLQAPIENMPFEIFRNNTQINHFTFGSDIKYIPLGMFYNSSLKSINMLAPNELIVSSNYIQSANYAVPAQAFHRSGDLGWAGTPNNAPLDILPSFNNNIYYNAIQIKAVNNYFTTNDATIHVPTYYAGRKVKDAEIIEPAVSGQPNTCTYSADGNLDRVDILNAGLISHFAINGFVNTLNHQYNDTSWLQAPAHALNLSNVRQIIQPKSNASELHLDADVVTLNTLVNYPSLTDIYIGDTTQHLRVENLNIEIAEPGSINLHVPNSLSDIQIINNKADVNIIVDEEDA